MTRTTNKFGEGRGEKGTTPKRTRIILFVRVLLALLESLRLVQLRDGSVALVAGPIQGGSADIGVSGHV